MPSGAHPASSHPCLIFLSATFRSPQLGQFESPKAQRETKHPRPSNHWEVICQVCLPTGIGRGWPGRSREGKETGSD